MLNVEWSRGSVQLVYVLINFLMMVVYLIVPETSAIYQLEYIPLYVMVLISWILYFMLAVKEPGYLGLPEPDLYNQGLNRGTLMKLKKFIEDQVREVNDVAVDDVELNDLKESSNNLEPLASTQTLKIVSKFGDIQRRWCAKCGIGQLVRTKHCFRCSQCVLRFDHHCTFTGVCIGQYNHGLFWMYLLVQTVVVLAFIGISIKSIIEIILSIDSQTTTTAGFMPSSVSLALLGLSLLFFMIPVTILVIPVFAFHTYLALSNRLTHEVVSQKSDFSTWPWYYKYLVTGSHDYNSSQESEHLLVVKHIDEDPSTQSLIVQKSCCNPFDLGIIGNIKHFSVIAYDGLFKRKNRGIYNRFTLNGQAMQSVTPLAAQFRPKHNNKERNNEDDLYSEYRIPLDFFLELRRLYAEYMA